MRTWAWMSAPVLESASQHPLLPLLHFCLRSPSSRIVLLLFSRVPTYSFFFRFSRPLFFFSERATRDDGGASSLFTSGETHLLREREKATEAPPCTGSGGALSASSLAVSMATRRRGVRRKGAAIGWCAPGVSGRKKKGGRLPGSFPGLGYYFRVREVT